MFLSKPMLSSNQASQTDKETKLDPRPLGEKGANIKNKQRTQIKSNICGLAKTFSSRLRLVLQGPLLDDPDLVGAGGIVVYGETALRCWKICCLTTALLISFTTFIFQGRGKFPRGVQNFSWGDHHDDDHGWPSSKLYFLWQTQRNGWRSGVEEKLQWNFMI